jgi:dinuclear metal center YbgI/SA1388 family protein
MTRVKEIVTAAEKYWPLAGAEDWDRPGLVAGSLDSEVTKVLLSVDVTAELIADAKAGGFDLIISHHPFLLRGVDSLAEDTNKGLVISEAIRSGIALYAAHTNADITATGVSATLAKAFGLQDALALSPAGETVGHGRIGRLPAPIKLVDFARQIAKVLPATAGGLKVAGDAELEVRTVALCGGAGDSFLMDALTSEADVFVTSDLRHHPTQDALEDAKAKGKLFAIIDISHWAAESLWLDVAVKELSIAVPGVKFVVSDLRTDPWDFAVTQ